MDTTESFLDLKTNIKRLRQKAQPLALVPTMGALHDGHLSLVKKAKADGCAVIATIFLNPTQFAAGEDLDRYPRPLNEDLAKFENAGVDLVWTPDVKTMYPGQDNSRVQISGSIASRWEGESRPTFFTGVATVVTKLFSAIAPDKAYFGEKDFQQLQLIKTMVRDFLMPIEIVACPTVRDENGLALSSRNLYLGQDNRLRASALYQALRALAAGLQDGKAVDSLVAHCIDTLLQSGFDHVDYVAVVHTETLEPISHWQKSLSTRILAAASMGNTRLIDNVAV